jgi:hypothetical protein
MKALICSVLLVLIVSCSKKETVFQKEGTLEQVDMAACPCCGGVVLTLDGQSGNYRIDSLPFRSQQQFYGMQFPKRIKFNYSSSSTCGVIEKFVVTDFFVY